MGRASGVLGRMVPILMRVFEALSSYVSPVVQLAKLSLGLYRSFGSKSYFAALIEHLTSQSKDSRGLIRTVIQSASVHEQVFTSPAIATIVYVWPDTAPSFSLAGRSR